MPVRLRDVAESAGVSVKTVSNVVHRYPFVTPATRAKVESALTDMGYHPNLLARQLRTGRSGLIGLSVPEIDAPYFAEIACKIGVAAERHGWTVLIDITGGDRGHEQRVTAGIRGHMVDGVIASPLSMTPHDIARLSKDHPLVLLGERLPNVPAPHVGVDSVAAAAEATSHLIALGRRRIAAIGAKPGITGTAALRLEGYRQALTAAGRACRRALVQPVAEYHRLDGFTAMNRLLEQPAQPDAVFCFNDLLALGAMRAVFEAGLRIPQDIAVVGFDDIEEGRYSVPSLSTIAADKDGIAEAAVRLLAERIPSPRAGGRRPGAPGRSAAAEQRVDVVVGHHLEIRESSRS